MLIEPLWLVVAIAWLVGASLGRLVEGLERLVGAVVGLDHNAVKGLATANTVPSTCSTRRRRRLHAITMKTGLFGGPIALKRSL